MFVRICSIVWHIIINQIQVTAQMIHGAWHIAKMPKPLISIFGGARMKHDDQYAQEAHNLARMLTQKNFSILTGGGPGIMEAVSCGAVKSKKLRNVGIGVEGLPEDANMCAQHYVNTKYFYARKWLLIRYSSAYVIFPGGFGTLDELAEVVTLMYLNRITKKPIFLFGKEYWNSLLLWIQSARTHDLVSQGAIDLLRVTDDLSEIVHCCAKELK